MPRNFATVLFLLALVLSLATPAISAEASSPYAVNQVNSQVKDNFFNLTIEQDAVLGVVVRFNAYTCVKTASIPLVVERRDPQTQEWRWIATKEISAGLTMEFEQSLKVPLGPKSLGFGLYRASFQNVLVQSARGACGTRQSNWSGLHTETVVFEIDANGAVMAPKARDIHRILAFDGIAYLDKVARFAVVAPEPFALTLYQEFGSQRFVFRQTVVEDVLSEGKWSQLTIDRFFPDTFRENLPVKYTMTGTKSGVTVFGIFAPPI